MIKRSESVILLSALTLCLGTANAGPVLDQSQLVYNGGLSATTLPGYGVSQSFTDGITGSLTEIDMGFFAGSDGPVYYPWSGDGTLRILTANGNHLLQNLTVAVSTLPQSLTWNDWAVDVPVTAGQQYLFDFTPNAASGIPNPYGVAIGTNANVTIGPYSGGDLNGDLRFDAVFQTWVDPCTNLADAPEPSSVWLVSASALMFVGLGYRRITLGHAWNSRSRSLTAF